MNLGRGAAGRRGLDSRQGPARLIVSGKVGVAMDGFVGTQGFCAVPYGLCLLACGCYTQLLFCYVSRLEFAEITRH